MSDGLPVSEIEWANSYDGYRRLAATPEKLEKLFRSARNSYKTRGVVPGWCGVDFLRGWAFCLVRGDYQSGGGTLDREWVAVLEAIRLHPAGGPTDLPPSRRTQVDVRRLDMPTDFSSEPTMHKDGDFLARKRARLWEPHVARINEYVDEIRSEIAVRVAVEHRGGLADRVHVPYVDPDSGGEVARVMFLLESPARPAALGSGMLSADNNDETAKNMWHAYADTGLPRTHGLHWNAVPWFVGTEEKNAGVTGDQVGLGNEYLVRLLDLAPRLGVVVAMGAPAQRAVDRIRERLHARGVHVIDVIHPSPRNYNNPKRDAKRKVHAAFIEAQRLCLRQASAPGSVAHA